MSRLENVTILHPISDYKQVNTRKGVSQYAEYLSEKGHNVNLIAYKKDKSKAKNINIEGVNIHIISSNRTYGNRMWRMLNVFLILVRVDTSVFITQFFGTKDLFLSPICWILGVKYMIVADYTPQGQNIPEIKYYKNKLELLVLSQFVHIFYTRTVESRDELCSFCSVINSQVKVLPSGIPDSYFEVNNEWGEQKLLIYVGSIIEDKNVDILINSFNDIKQDFESWSLHIAGDNPNNCDIGDQDRVMYRGFLSEAELLDLYKKADILCLPSLHESFSNVLIEAAATETAIVSTNVGIASELLADAGLIIAKNDFEDTKKKLRLYMENDRKRTEDAKKLRGKAEKYRLSWITEDIETEF